MHQGQDQKELCASRTRPEGALCYKGKTRRSSVHQGQDQKELYASRVRPEGALCIKDKTRRSSVHQGQDQEKQLTKLLARQLKKHPVGSDSVVMKADESHHRQAVLDPQS
ncbi:hypothetical protein ACF0H5_021799 [Mactra antiquata]